MNNKNFKIFFLFPDFKIETLAKELLRNHFETYLVYNENDMIEYIKKWEDSILFINIDQHYNDNKWEEYITKIMYEITLKKQVIALLTSYKKNKFLGDFLRMHKKVLFFKLSHKNTENFLILKNFLKNFRTDEIKIISVKCENGARFNIKIDIKNPVFIKGSINEISLTGMVCSIEDKKDIDLYLKVDECINNIQLNLNGINIIVSGYLFLKKDHFFIFKFSPIVDPYKKEKLNSFIFKQLQNNIKKINAA